MVKTGWVVGVAVSFVIAAEGAKAQSVNWYIDEGCKVINVSAIGPLVTTALDCTELTKTLRRTGKTKSGENFEPSAIDQFGYIVVCFSDEKLEMTPFKAIRQRVCQSLN